MTLLDSLHEYAPALHKKLILVDGPLFSGKSTLIETITDAPITYLTFSLEDYDGFPREVSLKVGKISIDNIYVLFLGEMYGRGGMFSSILERTGDDLMGAIILCDSPKPEKLRQTRSIIEDAHDAIPNRHIIAANKQDDPAAWSIDDLRIALRLNDPSLLFPCNATDRDSVKTILLALLEHIPQDDFVEQAAAKIQAM